MTFAEHDGLWWLKDKDLLIAAPLLKLRYEGQAVGFEVPVGKLYASRLLSQNIGVSVKTNEKLRTLRLRRPAKRHEPLSTPVRISVRSIFDEAELAKQIDHRAEQGCYPDGRVFVYRVDRDWYEVDWELTTFSQASVRQLAAAARNANEPLLCFEVQPRPRRGHARRAPAGGIESSASVVYGQLRLDL